LCCRAPRTVMCVMPAREPGLPSDEAGLVVELVCDSVFIDNIRGCEPKLLGYGIRGTRGDNRSARGEQNFIQPRRQSKYLNVQ